MLEGIASADGATPSRRWRRHGKNYAAPPREGPRAAALVRWDLEEGPRRAGTIHGAERFARLEDDHHTHRLFLDAALPTRAELFALRARIAGQVRMARLVRPRSREGFAASLELATAQIREPETTA